MDNKRPYLFSFWIILCVGIYSVVVFPGVAQDSENSPPKEAQSENLDDKIQNLKKEVMQLNRDLFILEEELLYPANTQLVVFLSLDIGTLFALDSVELKLNDKTVAHYLYTARELDALRRGGVQQLFIGNVAAGKNELVAFFTGKGPHGRDYRRGTSYVVEKKFSAKYVELKIGDDSKKQQPEFFIKEW